MQFLLFEGFFFGERWKIWGKQLFFQADTAGLVKYCKGRYGWISRAISESAAVVYQVPLG